MKHQTLSYYEALGMIASLTMQVELYRNWFIYDIDEMLVAAVLCRQYKIYLSDEGVPIAFVTWAILNDEDHLKMLTDGSYPDLFANSKQPDLSKWTNGSHLWFMDMVVLNKAAGNIVRDLQKNHFMDYKIAHAIRRKSDGSMRKMAVWTNYLAA
jgi:cytolysin-activating lysine-acyltransferase